MLTARFSGALIDEATFDQAVEEATRAIIARQIETGLSVVNNGELGRESFFTYVQHRMTGFGGASTRPIMAALPTARRSLSFLPFQYSPV